jgi:uncharacterized protein (TIGR01370 family)
MSSTYRHAPRRSLTARLLTALALLAGSSAHAGAPNSVAIWYAASPPLASLAKFDWAVLEPGHLQAEDIKTLRALGGKPFAYLSVGELAADAAALDAAGLREAASAQRNSAWNSQVMDLRSPVWRDYLLQRAQRYKEQGYVGLFLDTLDSFQLQPEAQREAQRQALVSWLKLVHERFPQLTLIFNRGFEVLPDLPGVATAIAVESIHAGWDAGARQFRPVPPQDREWLLARLAPFKAQGMALIAIDYLPRDQGRQAHALTQRLCAEGFIPFVTTPQLDHLAVDEVRSRGKTICP